MRYPLGLAAAGAVVAVVSALAQTSGESQGSFRTTTDLVTVDVAVRSGRDSAANLRTEDFVLLDNGVKQTIESLDAARVPLDVSLLVDTSGSFSPSWWGKPKPSNEIAAELNDIVRKASAVLRADDRLRVVTIDTDVNEVMPLQAPSAPVALSTPIASNGLSSLHDALVETMMRRVEPGRRHLIVAMTKADDTISAADLSTLQEVARRSDAVLHIVLGDSLVGNTACTVDCEFPRTRFWRPFARREESALPTVAEITGGAVHGYNALGLPRDFSGTFAQVFDDFRRGYVLRYTPQGVKREGWHEIQVAVPSRPSAVVNARRGYAIDAVPPPERPRIDASVSERTMAGRLPPVTVESVTAAYERRDYAEFHAQLLRTTDLPKLLRSVRDAGNPWPAAPRREAVFVLELLDFAFSRQDPALHREGAAWLEQYGALVRQPFEADRFECSWYWGEITLLEGSMDPALGRVLAYRARERCPDEPRVALAQAVTTDQRWPLGLMWAGVPSMARPSNEQLAWVRALYVTAMNLAPVAAEAHVRAAWFEYRVGQFDDALRLLPPDDDPTADRMVRYLHQLVRGQALRETGRLDEAAAAFRAALVIWPGAQSARVALMTLRVVQGDRQEAETLSGVIETADDNAVDPWWLYWHGDYRGYPSIITNLRELAR